MNCFYDLDGKENGINVGYRRPQHDMGFSSTGPVCAANVSNGTIESRPSAYRSTRIVRSSKLPTAYLASRTVTASPATVQHCLTTSSTNVLLMQTKHGPSSQDNTWQARATAVHLVDDRLLPSGKAAFERREKARMEARRSRIAAVSTVPRWWEQNERGKLRLR